MEFACNRFFNQHIKIEKQFIILRWQLAHNTFLLCNIHGCYCDHLSCQVMQYVSTSIIHQSCFNHTSIKLQSYFNQTSIMLQSCFNHTSIHITNIPLHCHCHCCKWFKLCHGICKEWISVWLTASYDNMSSQWNTKK